MTPRHAVISGASIAGLSAAYWLRHVGWEVTVVERAPEFRDGGQNVDVRGVAREVLGLMGLTAAIKAQNTTETATVLVDGDGAVTAELPTDGPDASTAELEVLRGDFARTILDHLPPGVEVVYDETVEGVDEAADGVTLTTASGSTLRADLFVVAEGVHSVTRDRLFPGEVEPRDLGIEMVFGTIPRTEDDDDRWRWHTTVGGRQVHLRPDNHGTTRAILCHTGDDELAGLERADMVARLRERYADVGWEAPRVLDGFETSDDVYVDHLTQIHMPTWHRGRVCLAGDAAWCVTPMGGGGASLALVSGYVLAAHLSTDDDLGTALAAYETWMRPLVDQIQGLPPGFKLVAFPQTRLGLAAKGLLDKALTSSLLTPLTSRLTQVADTDQELPRMVPLPV
ncbi:FAD-dependent monooxygenase [Solicola sp. PLA-1-18]|uniref:FAD-dependent monooxygenase n=1 Tax=Solicola sp. PLA-1-18 TaxID=3380532 RepID=UPI003B79738C